ncbi:MAG: hypothetical protein QM493_02805 [Sulfurovum sp.]
MKNINFKLFLLIIITSTQLLYATRTVVITGIIQNLAGAKIYKAKVFCKISDIDSSINTSKLGEFNIDLIDVGEDDIQLKVNVNHKNYISYDKEIIIEIDEDINKLLNINLTSISNVVTIYYDKAKSINLTTKDKIVESYNLLIKSIEQKSNQETKLYEEIYKQLGKTTGLYLQKIQTNDSLPENMEIWINNFDKNKSLELVLNKNRRILLQKYFYRNIESSCNKIRNKSKYTDNTYKYCETTYNKLINLDQSHYNTYSGKYLFYSKSELYGEAINVIIKYFDINHNKHISQKNVLKLLLDWNNFMTRYTGFQGSNKDIEKHKDNIEYRKIWNSFYTYLGQYRNLYQNSNKKNIQELNIAYKNAKKIIQ